MDLESKILFRDNLVKDLKEKKKLSDSSIKTYMRNLTKLNKDEMFKNFNFLKDVDGIVNRLTAYKENTKRGPTEERAEGPRTEANSTKNKRKKTINNK
jgi:hypothetical protein